MATNYNAYVSSSSRNKLNSFRYVQLSENEGPKNASPSKAVSEPLVFPDQENQNTSGQNETADSLPDPPPEIQPSTQTKESKPTKECPKTPANRIPLADLISNTEDAFRLAPGKDQTPDEYVTWQHAPQSSAPSNASPTARGKKRRREGSSPGGSPRKNKTRKPMEPFDMKTIKSLLETPQNDVATELWNSYVGRNKGDGTVELPPKFVNLSSSPHTPVSDIPSKDSSGLRRARSCTADWPSTASKRKKADIYKDGRAARELFTRSKSSVLYSGRSSSRLNSLLERIQGSLARSKTKTEPPSSPPIGGDGDAEPHEATAVENQESPTRKGGKSDAPEGNSPHQGLNPAKSPGSSSEFGGDEFDDDLLALVDASETPQTNQEPANALPKVPSSETDSDPPQSPSPVEQRKPPIPVINNDDNDDDDDDEFDDGDDFPEELLAQCDQQQQPTKQDNSLSNVEEKRGQGTVEPTTHGNQEAQQSRDAQCAADVSSDEFEGDDIDLDAIEEAMILLDASRQKQKHPKAQQAIKRYLITQIAESTYVNSRGYTQPEKVLSVEDEKTRQKKVIILRDSWYESPCSKHSYVHLIGDFDARGQCVVDDSQNMIILHPDHLISATVVADSTSCQRRAVLQDRIKATSDVSRPQVFGHILHEVFQECLKANRWDYEWIRPMVEETLVRYVESLYAIHVTLAEAADYVMSKIPELKAWAEVFLRARPTAASVVEDRRGTKASLSINKLLEIEEHIWSPMYGLKGNVDATVQVVYDDGEDHKTLTIPLEMKTGRKDTSSSHRAQTALYTLLLSDRYDIDVTFGLLYYLEMQKMFKVNSVRNEIIHMIQERNRLACFVREKTALPPMVKRPHLCQQCYSKTACFIYHKLLDDGDGETSGVGASFNEVVGHLDARHRDFFRKWDDLLTREERAMMKFRRELWTMLSEEREALGRCFSKVVIEPGSAYEDKNGTKINRYRYTFVKRKAPADFSFADSQITTGEPIVISDEKGHFALANGYVTNVSRSRITVAVDRRLDNSRVRCADFDSKRNQAFKGIIDLCEGKPRDTTAEDEDGHEPIVYRLDKDEFSNGMATVRNNLICMMEKNLFQAAQLRKLIIEGRAPTFRQIADLDTTIPAACQAELNVDQKRAVEKVLSAQDYALVLGMPGTGKTTTIAHIIRALVSQGKSVLLASYTHTAVDNILLKIRDDNVRILRIGATAKVHPEVQQFADLAAVPKTSIEELKESYEQSSVVATTCLGVNHPIFNERIFDYCIVDEASQITLPVCLGPIRMARTFILVGDHYQLPPLVQDKEAQEGGLDVSLFKLLSDAQPSSVVNLEHQYRMCEDLMLLSNKLIYSGRLKCGTPEVASRSLHLPDLTGGLRQHHVTSLTEMSSQQGAMCLGPMHGRCWLRDLLDPSAKTRLVNTDPLGDIAREETTGSRIVNDVEATICAQLVEALISAGVPVREIGVITFYRSQLSALRQRLRRFTPELEMHTTDKFQGRDKEVIVLSCVRSNAEKQVGELLRDWRRINVAFTRARTKLLVVGSKATLRGGNELLAQYVRLMDDRAWVYDLPGNALADHVFADLGDAHYPSPTKMDTVASPDRKNTGAKRKGESFSSSPTTTKKSKLRSPEKRGAIALSRERVLKRRPVLEDLVNEFVG